MGERTKIEWTDASWSPIRARNIKTGKVGWYCEHATTGCEFCYAESMNKRLGTGLPFKPGHRKDVELFLDDTMLLAPLRWKKPRMIFVCSMTDLFADFVTDEWIDKVFAVMAMTQPRCIEGISHTYQILTKRPDRMLSYLSKERVALSRRWARASLDCGLIRRRDCGDLDRTMAFFESLTSNSEDGLGWPLPNVWLGVSTERQEEADERIPHLLQTPAAVRFISAEPLLGPIDLTAIEAPDKVEGERWTFDALTNGDYYTQHSETMLGEPRSSSGDGPYREHALDWVIVGGESGPNARPMQMEWAMALVDLCAGAEVACFVKQLGSAPISGGYPHPLKSRKGGDPDEWPRVLNVRQTPRAA